MYHSGMILAKVTAYHYKRILCEFPHEEEDGLSAKDKLPLPSLWRSVKELRHDALSLTDYYFDVFKDCHLILSASYSLGLKIGGRGLGLLHFLPDFLSSMYLVSFS